MDDTDLKKMEYEDFKENNELKAILAGQHAKKLSVVINGIDVHIRAAIPKALRNKLIAIAKAYQNEDVDSGDEDMYEVMAQICLDPPFNRPEVWRYVDIETGETPNVLKNMIEKITNLEVGAKRFR